MGDAIHEPHPNLYNRKHLVPLMQYLGFISTNIGTAAVRRHPNAELLYYSQVWFRTETGEWKRYHYYSKEKDNISSGLLESMYRNVRSQDIPAEDWW